MAAVIRHYQPSDRVSIRRIACDTADRGRPMESFSVDREFLADFLTSYYTDFEPGSVWVAEEEGAVVGYLTGCLDTRRYVRIMSSRLFPWLFFQACSHGSVFRIVFWKMIASGLMTWFKEGNYRAKYIRSHPAHFHINLEEKVRGQGYGQKLVNSFFEQVQQAGVKGIHLGIHAENGKSHHFFEEMGFKIAEERGLFFPAKVGFIENKIHVMVREMNS